ncbi:hypothetical protein [Roseomonas populi]|uniref:Uncharacterized protein n=1 Tax=Roseomonas populi TaxID=3121582 RepID=A0ABT1XBD1_9PROT|nr:hypothetical protein [Roseomonas pecuniae]MCR0984304.1 hypothetical protein [Roseomonas pecuniae]
MRVDRVVRVVRRFGDFGERWGRDITPLVAGRGIDDPWAEGGLQQAPPML